MSDSTPFVPRVVEEIPPARPGSPGRGLYDQVFKMAIDNAPNAVLASVNVPEHYATTMREALASRLKRPANAHLAESGTMIVAARKTKEEVAPEDGPRVDLYVEFAAKSADDATAE